MGTDQFDDDTDEPNLESDYAPTHRTGETSSCTTWGDDWMAFTADDLAKTFLRDDFIPPKVYADKMCSLKIALDLAIERPQDYEPLPRKPTDVAGYEALGKWAGRQLPHIQEQVARRIQETQFDINTPDRTLRWCTTPPASAREFMLALNYWDRSEEGLFEKLFRAAGFWSVDEEKRKADIIDVMYNPTDCEGGGRIDCTFEFAKERFLSLSMRHLEEVW
ncbi:MAG: hypothetical protein Q9208_003358 [Pyrenodesmia sp. 3 TL-2023]